MYDTNSTLLYLENRNQDVRISMKSRSLFRWDINAGNHLNIQKNDVDMFSITDVGNVGINKRGDDEYEYTLDVVRVDGNNDGCVRLKNSYESKNDEDVERLYQYIRAMLICRCLGVWMIVVG